MGSKCSTNQLGGTVGILGNGNSAIIINGIQHNISGVFNTAVNLIMQKYRFELILMHFTSVFLVVISVLLVVRCIILRGAVSKGETT